MATGTPDFNKNESTNPSSPLFDTGEGANHTLMGGGAQSRAGRWIYATGFEDSLAPFSTGLNGPGTSSIGIVTDKTYQGKNSLKLNAGTVVDYGATLAKYFLIPGSKQGIEMYISPGQVITNPAEIHIQIRAGVLGNDGVWRDNSGRIVIVVNTYSDADIFIDVNGTRTFIANIDRYWVNNIHFWHYFKLVYDIKTNKFHRLYFDDLVIDLSTYSGYSTTAGTINPAQFYLVELRNKGAGLSYSIYIDNYIITADEP